MQEPEDGIRWQSPLIKVVFPHPFGPRSAVSVFDLSVNETLETIGFLYPAENPVKNDLQNLLKCGTIGTRDTKVKQGRTCGGPTPHAPMQESVAPTQQITAPDPL